MIDDSHNLRVLLAVRQDLLQCPGGDTVQVINTARQLEQLGVEVVISADCLMDLSTFDCVHLWNLERVHETYVHMTNARSQGKCMVLSPIYWTNAGSAATLRRIQPWRLRPTHENAKNVYRYLQARSTSERRAIGLALRRGWARCRREILDSVGAILPNSQAEARLLAAQAPPGARIFAVPNGVDPELCRRMETFDFDPPPRRSGVLCVAHFDVRKNQLRLIEALRDTDIQVTFVGRPRRMHEGYFRRCLLRAGPYMKFLGLRNYEEVLQLMLYSKVHVCPSHFETPGLASLEAAALGCRLALGDCPPVREYFQDHAVYFASRDVAAIRRGVLAALDAPPAKSLPRRVLDNFTWMHAAKATLGAYRAVLGRNHRNENHASLPAI